MEIKVGDHLFARREIITSRELMHPDDKDKARVMAIAEGYVMLHKKGCMPFIRSIKDLQRSNSENQSRDRGNA